jgi:hypothetical protein
MKVKTSELTGASLDWALEECLLNRALDKVWAIADHDQGIVHAKGCSTDWLWVGPIIEREMVNLDTESYQWRATVEAPEGSELNFTEGCGPTPLIAAARCYVASKLGDEIDIPEELK